MGASKRLLYRHARACPEYLHQVQQIFGTRPRMTPNEERGSSTNWGAEAPRYPTKMSDRETLGQILPQLPSPSNSAVER
ncbi:hypothetical protein ACVITL_000279 [Rhizobium pisi]